MNKQDITIVALLVAALIAWLFYQNKTGKEFAEQQAKLRAENQARQLASLTNTVEEAFADTGTTAAPGAAAETAVLTNAVAVVADAAADEASSTLPEETAVLSNNEVKLTVSSKGGVITSAVLNEYKAKNEEDSAPVEFAFADNAPLSLVNMKGLGRKADFTIVEAGETQAVLSCTSPAGVKLVRTIALGADYRVSVKDSFVNESGNVIMLPDNEVRTGFIDGNTETLLAVDSLSAVRDDDGDFKKVVHWEGEGKILGAFGASSGGCSGKPTGNGLPRTATVSLAESQEWVAIKSRFFTQIFSAPGNAGFKLDAARKDKDGVIDFESLSGSMLFKGEDIAAGKGFERSYSLYIGPKKLSALRRFGENTGEIMEFGTFKWVCIILVPTLNFLYMIFRNYGLAIIALTVIVRFIFWPLTRKSTESMKKMREIQPLLKEIQTKYKDNPQRMQQETMQIYREHHVNPMSSCLPMLIQIPVFIALFTVLRSAVELRYASFLWIADLSEAENLFAGKIPFAGSLNILPLVMAGTMYLQSKLTPSMGDPSQQKMMMWMMPLMMLFMFYQMPSALVLYWSISQILAIIQLWWQKRQTESGENNAGGSQPPAEATTRQARRRLAR